MTLKDLGVAVGVMPSGPKGSICDVPGVKVGHTTLNTERFHTGVTVVLPGVENPFLHKLPAGVCAYNGFGKTAGLMQVQELGRVETPIALTGTLNVGKVHDALVGWTLAKCAADGHPDVRSINPLVCECNDGTLSDIRSRPIGEQEVLAAFANLSDHCAEGCVGAGAGMICHDLKGGIGTASRIMKFAGKTYTLGLLAQTNHGSLKDLTIGGRLVGPRLAELTGRHEPDKGSCIMIVATDLPLDSRQLSRVAKRCSVGLARLGSYIGHGSGEVFVAFSTANQYDELDKTPIVPTLSFREDDMDVPFRAAAECAEEAILRAMLAATTTVGWQGDTIYALADLWDKI